MFRRNLAVTDDNNVGTPAITPVVSTPSTDAMTPVAAMTPSFATPGGGTVVGGQGYEAEEQNVEEEVEQNVEEDEGEAAEEQEDDIIKRFTMQNPFTPANAMSVFTPGNTMSGTSAGIVAWAETPSSAAAVSTPVVATPGTMTPATFPSDPATMKPSDLQSQIAVWKTKLGASPPIIHNVVATASLGVDLDLKKIALTARNAEFNPRRFAAVILRIRDPKSTALVFKSGKLVVTGTKSQEEARNAARKFGRVITKVGYPEARFKGFKVENLVSTFTVPFPIHLEQLYKNLPANVHSQYEPEVFPELIFKVPTGGTVLVFVSGKCVMIGMKNQEDIDKAFLYVLPKLNNYRKK